MSDRSSPPQSEEMLRSKFRLLCGDPDELVGFIANKNVVFGNRKLILSYVGRKSRGEILGFLSVVYLIVGEPYRPVPFAQ